VWGRERKDKFSWESILHRTILLLVKESEQGKEGFDLNSLKALGVRKIENPGTKMESGGKKFP
jgi:hypothetical protein